MSARLLVTGTSTEVGKTVVTAAVAAAVTGMGLRVTVCKPAQTGLAPGEQGDVHEVLRLSAAARGTELVRLAEPLAPATAARRAGRRLPSVAELAGEAVSGAADSDLLLVEGAGGLLVQLNGDGETAAELAEALNASVLVVAQPDLGTLNHVALTREALAARGLSCLGVVIGSWPPEPDLAMRCNRAELAEVAGAPLLGVLPAGASVLPEREFRREAAGWMRMGMLLPGLGLPGSGIAPTEGNAT